MFEARRATNKRAAPDFGKYITSSYFIQPARFAHMVHGAIEFMATAAPRRAVLAKTSSLRLYYSRM
jgi:hypothetical protein